MKGTVGNRGIGWHRLDVVCAADLESLWNRRRLITRNARIDAGPSSPATARVFAQARIVEGGLTDRELTELITEKLSDISSMYKEANLTVIGDKADAMSSIIAPVQAITGLIKGFINSSKDPAQPAKQKK